MWKSQVFSQPMVLILDGSSELGAFIWSKSGISNLYRPSVTSTCSIQIRFFSSYVRNMFWATILYKYHDSALLRNLPKPVSRIGSDCIEYYDNKNQIVYVNEVESESVAYSKVA